MRIDVREAFAASVADRFRRAVIDADGVTINLSRTERFFIRDARLAVQLSSTTCMWPGCLVPTTGCQIDHIEPWATKNRRNRRRTHLSRRTASRSAATTTSPKRHGYTVIRGPDGLLHIYRPDGTEIL